MMNQELKPTAWWMKSSEPDYVKDYLTLNTPTREQKISHQAIPLYTMPELLNNECACYVMGYHKLSDHIKTGIGGKARK